MVLCNCEQNTKIKIYNRTLQQVVTYKCETWKDVKYMGKKDVDGGIWINNWTKGSENHQ
jgi:hypothetical protein